MTIHSPVAQIPDAEDDLVRLDTDPPFWHVRETINNGYPLMGSSPAERAESDKRLARIRKAADITDHPFIGGGPHCEAMLDCGVVGDPATTGAITMSSQCGYPEDLHGLAGEVGQ